MYNQAENHTLRFVLKQFCALGNAHTAGTSYYNLKIVLITPYPTVKCYHENALMALQCNCAPSTQPFLSYDGSEVG